MKSTNNVSHWTRKGGIILAEERIQHDGSQYKPLKGFEIVPV
jgi:hypothetical protein